VEETSELAFVLGPVNDVRRILGSLVLIDRNQDLKIADLACQSHLATGRVDDFLAADVLAERDHEETVDRDAEIVDHFLGLSSKFLRCHLLWSRPVVRRREGGEDPGTERFVDDFLVPFRVCADHDEIAGVADFASVTPFEVTVQRLLDSDNSVIVVPDRWKHQGVCCANGGNVARVTHAIAGVLEDRVENLVGLIVEIGDLLDTERVFFGVHVCRRDDPKAGLSVDFGARLEVGLGRQFAIKLDGIAQRHCVAFANTQPA